MIIYCVVVLSERAELRINKNFVEIKIFTFIINIFMYFIIVMVSLNVQELNHLKLKISSEKTKENLLCHSMNNICNHSSAV